jgi:hypothetical protein
VAERRDLDGLRAQADADDGYSLGYADVQASRALFERGDLDGLRALADVGYPGADFYQPQLLVSRAGVKKRSGCAGSASTQTGQLLVREEGASCPPDPCHLNCNVLLCGSTDRFAKLRLQGQRRRADENIRCSCRP